jgi:hypothetical protein
MTKLLFKVLLVLAALLISSPVHADSSSSSVGVVPIDIVSIPVIQQLPPVNPSSRIKRGEVCPPEPEPSDPWPADAVSLVGGCQTTSKQQLQYAKGRQLPLMTTVAEYKERIASGYFVPFEGPYLHVLADRPYALPSTVAFVTEMSVAYKAAGCGKLVVRDALRLTTERPKNGSIHSVHPAGMAVDIRVQYIKSECADWLRSYVRLKEAAGKVDGTHELKPEHLHVVVPIEPRIQGIVQSLPDSISVGAP